MRATAQIDSENDLVQLLVDLKTFVTFATRATEGEQRVKLADKRIKPGTPKLSQQSKIESKSSVNNPFLAKSEQPVGSAVKTSVACKLKSEVLHRVL